ncbi:MAG: hypothetical protein GWP91_04875 [Rhodobacterales bacterium]|nr:hypothetical protein [Rhodobacterales bacterium]
MNTGVAIFATALAITAGVIYWPRPPSLDGERWFKVILATLFRGQVEAEEGDVDAWEGLVRSFVPYHPAGRLPERKVLNPKATAPGAWLPGELLLTQNLAAIDDIAKRWALLYESEAGIEARLIDPFELGATYNPKSLGDPACTWDALALWGAGDVTFRDALLKRVGAKWLLIEGRPDRLAGPSVLDAMAAELGDRAVRVPWVEAPLVDGVQAVGTALEQVIQTWRDRVIVVSEEAGTTLVLRTLAANGNFRDPLLAVLSVGGVVGGREGEEGPFGEKVCDDWVKAWFTYEGLDSESVRLTPYLSVQFLDRSQATPGSAHLPIAAQRFPEPRDDHTLQTLESVDLGVLPSDSGLPVDQIARGLIAVTGCWALSRR